MESIALVLGSGGARGLAHIGVIRLLEERGYGIRCIAGSSIGALIGGIHAAGKLDEFEEWVRAISRVDIVTYLDVAWGKGGLVKGDRIINALVDLVGDVHIEVLPIRFTAVATDLVRQREVVFTSGRLFDAIRASMSVPLLFTPCTLDGVDYIDGGVLNPVPVTALADSSADLTVAVYCGGQATHPEPESESRSSVPSKLPPALLEVQDKIRSFMHRFFSTSVPQDESRDWGTYEVAMQSFEAMQNTIARHKLAAFPPDILVEIPRNACRTIDYDRAAELIALGYDAARKTLDR
ncbi:MAG: patatin-like phospholipase family protein [Bacteroidetes bacterium]|nr:patatin-like phospholipase family protein [Bacteroidota bacterium]